MSETLNTESKLSKINEDIEKYIVFGLKALDAFLDTSILISTNRFIEFKIREYMIKCRVKKPRKWRRTLRRRAEKLNNK